MKFKVVINIVGLNMGTQLEVEVARLPMVGDFISYEKLSADEKIVSLSGKVLSRSFSLEVGGNEEKVYLLIDEKQNHFAIDNNRVIIA